MKRSDMHAGQKVAYRFPAYAGQGRHPIVVEAEIIDPQWEVPARVGMNTPPVTYNGEEVRCGYAKGGEQRILYRLPGYVAPLRTETDGRPFTAWADHVAEHTYHHLVDQKLTRSYVGDDVFDAAYVSDVEWRAGDGTERGRFMASEYSEGFTWRAEKVQRRGDRYYVTEGDAGFVAEVDPTRLFGAEWIAVQHDREVRRRAAAAEESRRRGIADGAAERLGLGSDRISVGTPHYAGKWMHTLRSDDEVLVAVPVRALVGLLDRAVTDPAWYERMVAEGVLDALGQ